MGFENNPAFLWEVPSSGGDQITDRCPGIHPGSGEIPVRKQDDLCLLVFKINIHFTPFAVAVCLIQVGCGGDFLFPACYRFLFQIHNPEDFIFCQLADQAVQGGLVGKLPTFFCTAAGKNRNFPEGELFLHGLHTTAVITDSVSCLQYLPFLPGQFIEGCPHRLDQTVIGDNTAQISNTVRDDLLAYSILTQGLLTPISVRPVEDNEYEVISGYRRLHACKKAGIETVPALIYSLDRDAATIAMVDSNLHREKILPSEKAFAYSDLSVEEKNQLWKLVMKKATVYRSQDDALTVKIYPNLPK